MTETTETETAPEAPEGPAGSAETIAYLEGLEDGQRAAWAMQVRRAAARRALVVRGIREGALYGAAWAAGYLLAEWVRGNLGGVL